MTNRINRVGLKTVLLSILFFVKTPAWAGFLENCSSLLGLRGTSSTSGVIAVPDGEQIQFREGVPIVPDRPIIPFIEGEGIGPEITRALQVVLNEAVRISYGSDREIVWLEVFAGEKARARYGEPLPQETLDALAFYRVGIKGPLNTPIGSGDRSYNVQLRQYLDLDSCIRRIEYFPGVPSPLKNPENVDMVVFRQNTEDVYAGIEFYGGSWQAKVLTCVVNTLSRLSPHLKGAPKIDVASGIGIKPMSREATRKHTRRALQYAIDHGIRDVTIVHKGNIQKTTEGAFKEWAYELAYEEYGDVVVSEDELREKYQWKAPEGKIVVKDRIADNMFQQTKLKPEYYGLLLTPNLNGDYLSDDLAALVGGLGLAPGANVGESGALFEATHGTAPDIAGKGVANPLSLILSGVMMLEYLGWSEAASLVKRGIEKTIASRVVTGDLREMEGAQVVGTADFANHLIRNMESIKD